MESDDKELWQQLGDVEPLRSERRGFSPAEMVRCEACLRANPPTRASCLYCGAPLPVTETSARLRQPTLRKLEKWEQGFNVVLRPEMQAGANREPLTEVAGLLRLKPEDVGRIFETRAPLPLARAANADEASLIESRLGELGIQVLIIPDEELLPQEAAPQRIRALDLERQGFCAHLMGSDVVTRADWREVSLLVSGRFFERRVEFKERRGLGSESEITDARELSADEPVLDLYLTSHDASWRIQAQSFNFSCLNAEKSLVAAENLKRLTALVRERASQAVYDDSYNRLRHALSPVWPLEERTEAGGMRRLRPGCINTESVTISDNEKQFTNYSRLQHLLKRRAEQGWGR